MQNFKKNNKMKKIFLFVALAMMGVSTVGCSSDDNSSEPDASTYQEAIQGRWNLSKVVYLDKDKKVVGEKIASDNNGCGFDERVYAGNMATYLFRYKDATGTCKEEDNVEKFAINGSTITYTYEEDTFVETYEEEIVSLTKTKLVVIDLDTETESSAAEEGYPKGTVYRQGEFTKK